MRRLVVVCVLAGSYLSALGLSFLIAHARAHVHIISMSKLLPGPTSTSSGLFGLPSRHLHPHYPLPTTRPLSRCLHLSFLIPYTPRNPHLHSSPPPNTATNCPPRPRRPPLRRLHLPHLPLQVPRSSLWIDSNAGQDPEDEEGKGQADD